MTKKHQDLKEDFISRLSERTQHGIALLILFLMPLILYSAIFFGGKHFMGNDVIQWRAGAQSVIAYKQQHNDNHPLWDSNMFSGMPSYVVDNPAPPPNIDSFIKWISGHAKPIPFLWILLAGAYCFFIIQGLRPFSSALGSILIGFTTYIPIIIEAGHYNKFVAFCFVPWIFFGYYLVSRSEKKWWAFFIFALAMTLELRAHHPQVTYYFMYLLGFWWIYDTWLFYKKDQIKEWIQRTGIAIGGGILSILCSIDVYWRLYEYAHYSTRGGSTLDTSHAAGLSMQYAFSWSQGIGELFTLIIPGLYGGSSGQVYWGPKPFTSGPHYFGAIAFVLALIGLFRYRNKLKYLFFGVGTLTMFFSLGSHFTLLNSLMFNYVPYFNKFRTPEMWLIVTVFCYSILAVYGIQALFDIAKDRTKSIKELYLPLGIALGLGLIFTLGSGSLLSFQKPGEIQQYSQQLAQQNNLSPDNPQVRNRIQSYINSRLKPKRKDMASSDSIRYLVLVLLGAGLIVGFVNGKLSKGYLLAGLVLLTAYDMLRVDARYTSEDNMVPDRVSAEQVIRQREQPSDKFIVQHINSGQGYPYRVYPLNRNPFNNAIPCYFYPSIGGYTGAKLAHYQDLIDHLLMNGNQGFNDPILDMLNVKYITTGQELPFDGYSQVFSQKGQYVYRNDNVLPKAFWVDSVQTVSSPQKAVDLMKPGTGFNPHKKAVVETNDAISAASDSAADVSVKNYNAKTIELSTSSASQKFLVLSEIYYPEGWHATIDGKPAKIYKTDFVLRGLQVPAGNHAIKMTFEPASDVWGGRIAWFGHIILWITGIGALIIWYNERDEHTIEEEA
ncbi:MAG TPA: YfhO family protein [Balneolaceae bacterium]|nr:YfhO family protein [Balneolaceae bacterium]